MAKEIHSKFKGGRKEMKKDTSVLFHLMGRLLQLKHASVIPCTSFPKSKVTYPCYNARRCTWTTLISMIIALGRLYSLYVYVQRLFRRFYP